MTSSSSVSCSRMEWSWRDKYFSPLYVAMHTLTLMPDSDTARIGAQLGLSHDTAEKIEIGLAEFDGPLS